MFSQPLSAYKVIDLSRVRAGPTAVKQLSDWGAQVIRVEIPKDPTDLLNNDDETDRSDYQNLQRNKRSIAINLKDSDGLIILKKLIETADVFIESFRPDVKYRLGIDYEKLKEINPRLIYASLSGFGQTGPYKHRPGYDQIVQGKDETKSTSNDQFSTDHLCRYEWYDVSDRSSWSRSCTCGYSYC